MSDLQHPSSTDEDNLTLLMLVISAAGAIAATAVALLTGAVTTAVDWALAHQVLVPAAAQPVLTIPAAGGAGLDGPRVALLAAAVLVVLTVAVDALLRVRRRARTWDLR